MRFSIKDFFSKCDQGFLQFTADLVTFTAEILNEKLQLPISPSERCYETGTNVYTSEMKWNFSEILQ